MYQFNWVSDWFLYLSELFGYNLEKLIDEIALNRQLVRLAFRTPAAELGSEKLLGRLQIDIVGLETRDHGHELVALALILCQHNFRRLLFFLRLGNRLAAAFLMRRSFLAIACVAAPSRTFLISPTRFLVVYFSFYLKLWTRLLCQVLNLKKNAYFEDSRVWCLDFDDSCWASPCRPRDSASTRTNRTASYILNSQQISRI